MILTAFFSLFAIAASHDIFKQDSPVCIRLKSTYDLFCPIGEWAGWNDWGSCSQTCGGGEMSRTRVCEGRGECIGPSNEEDICNEELCPGIWTAWGDWSSCGATCGGGAKKRTRTCVGPGKCIGPEIETIACMTQVCPGIWGNWGGFGSCTVTCGSGQMLRRRLCTGPGQCAGSSVDSTTCNNQACPGPCLAKYNGKCFFIESVSNDEIEYDEGKTMCRVKGGNPANIYSKSHYDTVWNKMREMARAGDGQYYVWLGMRYDSGTSTNAILYNGSPAPYTRWHSGYPNRLYGSSQITLVAKSSSTTRSQHMHNWRARTIKDARRGILCEK